MSAVTIGNGTDRLSRSHPILDGSVLWTNQLDRVMYMWGCLGVPDWKSLWKFTLDENTTGDWSEEPSTYIVVELTRSAHAAWTTCHDVGVYLGSAASSKTELNASSDWFPTPKLITYNIATSEWANETVPVPLYAGRGNVMGASAVCVPYFGLNGLVAFIGGGTGPYVKRASEDLIASEMVSFNEIVNCG
ncbi:hypothetical protein F5X99DRAFT_395863 [Biscogniauxia marginata]|nr:hypothetical protein F5X99DRAFT_395863 [Biscogniauxia marginata]